ncbi:nitrilase/cyanide hydratase and apolipo protein N-acyltransferase [Aspergillus similis]
METKASTRKLKLAAAQIAPVFLSKQATTDKVCEFIHQAGKQGADVVGFPKCVIPRYPGWAELMPVDRGPAHTLYTQLFRDSIEVPEPETEQIGQACADANVCAVVGVNERRPGSTGTTFNTQLIFGRDGRLLNKHQKFVPTLAERLIHTNGQTGSVVSANTDFGCLSGLICGENVNPLALYSMSLNYPIVHVASWPPHFTPELEMGDCILNSTRGLAFSLKCFVINSVGVVTDNMISSYSGDEESRLFLEKQFSKGYATILGPDGGIIAGPLGPGEGILYADVDLDAVIVGKYVHDVAGHYNRPELFALHFAPYLKD